MPRKVPLTWVVVADGARGRFFMLDGQTGKLVPAGRADLVAPQSRQKPRDLKSDKPGRSYSSARSGMRHALEPPHDYHKLEKHRFMAVLADALEGACEKRQFDDIMLVTPRRSLGELRGLLSKHVLDRVRLEVPKDLTNKTAAEIWRHLAPLARGF